MATARSPTAAPNGMDLEVSKPQSAAGKIGLFGSRKVSDLLDDVEARNI